MMTQDLDFGALFAASGDSGPSAVQILAGDKSPETIERQVLSAIEQKTLECKSDRSSPGGVLKTMVAFANTAGGILLLGIEDETRHVSGVNDPFKLEERIASLVADSILPKVLPNIEIHPFRDTHIVVIHVYPRLSRTIPTILLDSKRQEERGVRPSRIDKPPRR